MKPLGGGIIGPVRRAALALLGGGLADHGENPAIIVELTEARPWGSLTFVGEQIAIELRLIGAGGAIDAACARLAAGLAEDEIAVPGHFVADATLERLPRRAGEPDVRLRIEALVLED